MGPGSRNFARMMGPPLDPGARCPGTTTGSEGKLPTARRSEPGGARDRARATKQTGRGRGPARHEKRRWNEKAPRGAQSSNLRGYWRKLRQRPTLPHCRQCSTIGSEELNFRVRDGIGWNLFDITTGKLWIASQPELYERAYGLSSREGPGIIENALET